MTWHHFPVVALTSLLCWYGSMLVLFRLRKVALTHLLILLGLLIFTVFIAGLWITLGRPPLRTMGETRLWYSFFLIAVGYMAWNRWHYNWFLAYSIVVSTVFIFINLLKPEIHQTHLMPALQSPWFIPHVTVYILSYALLGAATIAAIVQLNRISKGRYDDRLLQTTDNLIYAGLGLLIAGMLMGALWAKQAWGDYWSWDLKETWAFLTAAVYLIYIHLRLQNKYLKTALWILPAAFIFLMITWLGVQYLPGASHSIHVYS